LLSFDSTALFISAVLAGWLMALGAWLILATHSTIGQIICIYIVTFLIGLGGLHHSIAGTTEVFTALFLSSEITVPAAARFLACAIAGNAVGGSIFVALLNYGHIRKTRIMSG
jgi:formate/nitrite transporter FocA (FNT family)